MKQVIIAAAMAVTILSCAKKNVESESIVPTTDSTIVEVSGEVLTVKDSVSDSIVVIDSVK